MILIGIVITTLLFVLANLLVLNNPFQHHGFCRGPCLVCPLSYHLWTI